MDTMKKKFKCVLILITTLVFLSLNKDCLDTEFKIVNHTLYPIVYNNYEFTERKGTYDFTPSEYQSYKSYYTILNNDFVVAKIERKYWINRLPLVVGINIRYHSKYLTDSNLNDLEGVAFRQYPKVKGQKSYCSYKIDIYPNRKAIVTPTNKKFCIKPLYYYPNS